MTKNEQKVNKKCISTIQTIFGRPFKPLQKKEIINSLKLVIQASSQSERDDRSVTGNTVTQKHRNQVLFSCVIDHFPTGSRVPSSSPSIGKYRVTPQ